MMQLVNPATPQIDRENAVCESLYPCLRSETRIMYGGII